MKDIHARQCILFSIVCTALLLPNIVDAKQLPVPFTAQAPDNRWTQPWLDFCEEASLVMVDQYYQKNTQKKTLDKKRAKELMLSIFAVKNTAYGKSLDESAQKLTDLINNYYPWEAYVVEQPTLEHIKEQIDLGRPVLIPAAGKDLKNPRFRNGGPRYHVLVVSGYDDEKREFITQEPGTQLGLDFRYSYDILLNAIHDLTSGDIRSGAKRAVFTTPDITTSLMLDGDKDGLPKSEEIAHGTSLLSKDTDADGYTDLQEIQSGYSPLINEKKLKNNSLIKSATGSAVFLLTGKQKRPILNEQTFLKRGYKWHNVKTVSDMFLSTLTTGPAIK